MTSKQTNGNLYLLLTNSSALPTTLENNIRQAPPQPPFKTIFEVKFEEVTLKELTSWMKSAAPP
jgi:hypothetical protein